MRRVVPVVTGGVLGLAAGSLLCARLVASAFGPTPVTWDASSCRPGRYAITATARSLSGPDTYVTSSSYVWLPQSAVTLEFPNLPPGEYSVIATAKARHGAAFDSEPQTVSGLGAWIPAGTRGHRSLLLPRPAATQPTNLAVPAPESTARQTEVRQAVTAPVPTRAASDDASAEDWLSMLSGKLAAWLDGGIGRGRVEWLDLDADGLMDAAVVELSSADGWALVFIDLRR